MLSSARRLKLSSAWTWTRAEGAFQRRKQSTSGHLSSSSSTPKFGILFDIDGVIVRGRQVLPFAPRAFEMLVDDSGRFRVPAVFVTNAGNTLRKTKAEQLSNWLGIEVTEEQVVMSHSPLKTFTEYHDKHVLVTGQGPLRDIASNLGFQKVTTIEQLRHAFPSLDAVDHKRRRVAPCAFENYFSRIDALVLFGEPTRWETSLQLILDVLLTNGLPTKAPTHLPYPHLPVLACNMDLQWMAEAVMPRFGHGAFLLALEHLYQKITGRELVYTALIGKPSEITYRHADHVLQQQARSLGLDANVRDIYFIGDNVCTDIFGANLYNRYLQRSRRAEAEEAAAHAHGATSRSVDRLAGQADAPGGADNCYSVLVGTGVYSNGCGDGAAAAPSPSALGHMPRDFLPVEDSYQMPTHTVRNVLEAVELIFNEQKFS